LTNTFLPDENGRAERLFTRLRHLKEYGWETVITVSHRGTTRRSEHIDGEEFVIYRPENKDCAQESSSIRSSIVDRLSSLTQGLAFPDNYVAFLKPLVFRTARIVRKEDADVLYTINYPFTYQLVGYLVSRLTGVPWLAEFRDPWVTNPIRTGRYEYLHQKCEELVVQSADALVYNYGIQVPTDYFQKRYPYIDSSKLHYLECPGSCGFDFERYEDIQPVTDSQFTITYAGAFHGDRHTPDIFLNALRTFMNRRGVQDSEIRVDFFGDWEESFDITVREQNLDDVVETHGWVPHSDAFAHLLGADVQLAMVLPEDTLNVPSKIVDYVASRNPILAITSKHSETAAFIRRHDLGEVAHYDDYSGVISALTKLYRAFNRSETETCTPSEDLLNQISSRRQTAEFAKALDAVSDTD
jgi:hypothetical protein